MKIIAIIVLAVLLVEASLLAGFRVPRSEVEKLDVRINQLQAENNQLKTENIRLAEDITQLQNLITTLTEQVQFLGNQPYSPHTLQVTASIGTSHLSENTLHCDTLVRLDVLNLLYNNVDATLSVIIVIGETLEEYSPTDYSISLTGGNVLWTKTMDETHVDYGTNLFRTIRYTTSNSLSFGERGCSTNRPLLLELTLRFDRVPHNHIWLEVAAVAN